MEEELSAQRIFLERTIENLRLRDSKEKEEQELGHSSREVFLEVFLLEPVFCLGLFRSVLQKYESLDQMRCFNNYLQVLLELLGIGESKEIRHSQIEVQMQGQTENKENKHNQIEVQMQGLTESYFDILEGVCSNTMKYLDNYSSMNQL